jgi:hypothetical protein
MKRIFLKRRDTEMQDYDTGSAGSMNANSIKAKVNFYDNADRHGFTVLGGWVEVPRLHRADGLLVQSHP